MPTMNGASLRVGCPFCCLCHSKPFFAMLVSVCWALSGGMLVFLIMVFAVSYLWVSLLAIRASSGVKIFLRILISVFCLVLGKWFGSLFRAVASCS